MNAVLLSGIVTTTSSSNSGGAEHIPRVLEDWTGDTLTYNGFMVGMYESRYATGLWQGTGSTIGIIVLRPASGPSTSTSTIPPNSCPARPRCGP